ncbi:MAG: response regulator [Syntrophobacterales bacterium]|nr:response regulator [Syntrophobacterales bacterium]
MQNRKIQKLLISAVIGLLIIVLGVSVFITLKNNRDHRVLLDASVKSNLISISVAAREILDINTFDSYNSKSDIEKDIRNYKKIIEDLRSLQKKVGATYIYALKQIDGKYYFIFDTDYEDESLFEEYDDISKIHLDAFGGKESAGIMNVVDKWGSYNTGAVPVWKDDKIIGVISTDIEDQFIRASQRAAMVNVIILIVTLSIVMFANILLIRRFVITPVKRLTDSVSKTGIDIDSIFGSERNDEIGELARKIQEMMGGINRRDKLLSTVNHAITLLLQAEMDDFEDALWRSMGMMASAVNVDRMYIWKNHEVNGKLYCTQLYEWSEGAEPQQGNEYTIDIPYDENIPEWEHRLSSGQCINSIVRNMSPREQAQLSPQGIISILVVPVYLRNDFWGFIGFDDCRNERLFTENEESVLRSGSLLIANALLRHDMTQELASALYKAQAASRAKSGFLSNMSHEIRTPMNAIIGMTSIAESTDNARQKDYAIGKIKDASIHLLGVINDVLDMSKIEADKLELHPVTFVFEEMLKKVTNIINFRVVEKHQRLAVYIDENIPYAIICDDQRLAQVITNLLSNAVKFTPENGSISLSTRLLNEENGFCTIRFDVTDTGVGISEEQQARLFNPFEQAESSTTRNFGGTGLGLSISKRIVEMMGGEISIISELGTGSTFTFSIKTEISAEDGKDKLLPVTNFDVKNMRILIVDDDEDIREYFVNIARRFGIACDVAASGEDALGLIEKGNAYDVYFIDWKMPAMDGMELTRRIRDMDSGKSVCVMISSAELGGIKGNAKNAGIDEFLSKPIFPTAIIDCINKCFGVDILNERQKGESSETDRFEGYCVLLVEDVEINREIVLALLEPTFLNIDCAENGEEAVRMFSERPDRYNMIFMDIQMPVMDGYEATRSIRALDTENAGTIPIIAMTANVFKEDIEKCFEAGMNGHVGKPLDFDEVLLVIRKCLFKQNPSVERRKGDRRKNGDRRRISDRRHGERRKGDDA